MSNLAKGEALVMADGHVVVLQSNVLCGVLMKVYDDEGVCVTVYEPESVRDFLNEHLPDPELKPMTRTPTKTELRQAIWKACNPEQAIELVMSLLEADPDDQT